MTTGEPFAGATGGPPEPDSYVLADGIALADALEEVVTWGAAFVPDALTEIARARLCREARRADYEPFRDGVELAEAAAGESPAADELRRSFAASAREAGLGIRGLATYAPNDVSVLKFSPGSEGLPLEREAERHRRLVAAFTLRGSATVVVSASRSGEEIGSWEAGPGSLVLLRGPGLGGLRDGRPYREVCGPGRGTRLSLVLRMRVDR